MRARGLVHRLRGAGEVPHGEQVRAAELIGTLCLATDLGIGFPFEHGLQVTLIAMRLGERLPRCSATTAG